MFRDRYSKGVVALIVLAAVAGGSFWFGFRYGEKYPQNLIVQGVANLDDPQAKTADFSVFWQAWELIQDNYLKNDEVSASDKVYGAIQGLVGSLDDPYSEYFPPTDSQKFQEDVYGSFGGIGAELGVKDGQITIVAPLKDTPAERAGIMAGDKILQVDASSTDDITVEQAVKWIRGPVGTEVELTILRENWPEPKEITIVRDTIMVPTLDAETRDGIAYVRLYSFNANAPFLFARAVFDALSQNNKGMVLDLRNNPGGYLETAVELAGWFLKPRTLVVSEVGRGGVEEEKMYANGNAVLADTPLVVLINQGSASAAEILAGALRAERGVKLVGEKSFGKGTVQKILDLKDSSSLKVTVAHWVLPNGEIIEEKGLTPDVEVKMTEEDVEEKRDPQLDKALELVEQTVSGQ